MSGRFWTTHEIQLLRYHYPRGGIDACLAHLNRTRYTIYQQARRQGLHAPGQPEVRRHYPNDASLDAALIRLHQMPLLRGAIVEFGQRWQRPTWYISRRARELGLKTPRFKEPAWTAREIEILHQTAHISTRNARARFAKEGFTRSETAIHVKRKRERISVRQARQDAGVYNVQQLSELFGVDAKTPMRWVTLEGLKARRCSDFVLVRESDLRAFIIAHPFRIELRKIPASHYAWFIELLAGKAGLRVEDVA